MWAVHGVEGVEQRAQHTALWGASAETDGCGDVGAHSNPLSVITEEVLALKAGGVWKSYF